MRVRYQGGYLRLGQKKGLDRWEFLWWDGESNGVRVRRKAIIGTVQQYAELENAWQASNGLRVSIIETRNHQREQAATVADLVDHCSTTELVDDLADGGKSHAACHDPDGIGRRMCQHSFANSEESFLSI